MNGKILYICGSLNQTIQLHSIARCLPEWEAKFSAFYGDRSIQLMRQFGVLEYTIAGNKLRERCLSYLREHALSIDDGGRDYGYDLVVTCTDVVVPSNVRGVPIVAVQEGILDPDGLWLQLVRRFPRALPRWLAGTAATGLSGIYDRFCVASEGYREWFIERGAPADRVVATGIPNFDNCESHRYNDFPHRGYALACTSDARETLKWDNRRKFVWRARRIAGSRPLFFKLHPNENAQRASAEIAVWAPGAQVFADGPTNAMIANCDILITQYSSVAFVGLALGKEVHSYHPIEALKRLVPAQHGRAAANIAAVCREVLEARGERQTREVAA